MPDDAGHPLGAPADISFRRLAEALPHLVWIADASGRTLYYNERASSYRGITLEDDGFWSWEMVLHPEDRERTEAVWAHATAAGVAYECEHRVQMADGSFRWHLSRALPVSDGSDGGVTWYGTATDIDAQKSVERALRESEQRLSTIIGSIDQGYCLCDLVFDGEGRAVDYRFLEVNPLFEEASGLRDAQGHTALELVPDLEPYWVETYSRVALGGGSLRFEQSSHAMGRRFDVFATAVPPKGRFALVFSDVTQRRAAELALRESEERFRTMADHAPVMIWVTEQDGSCSYLSRSWYEFTGQTPASGLGFGWLDVTHPEDRERAERGCAAANRAGRAFELDYRLRRHDGTYRWMLDAATPRFDGDGVLLGYIGSVIDITDRKEAEEHLRSLREEDRRMAVRLQRALLPESVAEAPGLDVVARYVAAQNAVGGDWYETFVRDDGRLGIVVGDVVGHDLDAAVVMGQLRAGMLALATFATGPAELLDMGDRFVRLHGVTDFTTACCAFVDPVSGEVSFASAGHPPMLVVEPGGASRWLEGDRSPPLGVVGGPARRDGAAVLERGALLIAYSDGLVERRHESIDVGLERFREAAEAARHLPLDELGDRLVEAMAAAGGFEDDIVITAVRRDR